LMTTHLLSSATAFVDEFVVLRDGEVQFIGTPTSLADSYQLPLAKLDDLFDMMQKESADGVE